MYTVYLYIYLILCYNFLCIQAVPGHNCGDMDLKKKLKKSTTVVQIKGKLCFFGNLVTVKL